MSKAMMAVGLAAVLGGCAMEMATEEDIALAEAELDDRLPSDPGGGEPPLPDGWVPTRGVDPCPECRFVYIPTASSLERVGTYRLFIDLPQTVRGHVVQSRMLFCEQSGTCSSAISVPLVSSGGVYADSPQFVYPTASLTDRLATRARALLRIDCDNVCISSAQYDTATRTYWFVQAMPDQPLPSSTSPDRIIRESASSRWVPPVSGTYDPGAIIWYPPIIFRAF